MLSPARSPLNSKPIVGMAFCILSCSSSWGCLVPRDSVETTKKVEGSGLLPRPAAAGRRNHACVGARAQAGRWPVLRRTLAPPCRFTPKLRGGAHGDQTSARARHASGKPFTADLVVRLCEYCSPCRQAVRQMKKKSKTDHAGSLECKGVAYCSKYRQVFVASHPACSLSRTRASRASSRSSSPRRSHRSRARASSMEVVFVSSRQRLRFRPTARRCPG